jgi:murein DD-endopeptidase MepM/ murein hydrolase activator NlpD
MSQFRWFVAALGVTLSCGALAYLVNRHPPAWLTETSILVPTLSVNDLPPLEPWELASPPDPGATLQFIVRRSDTLDRLFRRFDLNPLDLAEIRALKTVGNKLDQLRVDERIFVVVRDRSVQSLERRVSDTELLAVRRTGSGFEATLIETPVETRLKRAHGEIDSSRFQAALASGVGAETVMRLANDIFGWKIDFALEIQPGDRFNLIYEQKFREGQYLADGRIVAAEFINAGSVYRALHYTSSDARISGYFDPEGRSMRRQFLRAPLDFTRISSNFNMRRRHPILNLIRAHRGVDYAAPTGTEIRAAGDGRVSFAGVQGGYGNVVILDHGAGVSTLYGHMSRFAKSVRAGRQMQQGQAIGYVGSTGAATGPHLHYEYRIHGRHQNPRTVRLPDAKPIPANYLVEFEQRSTGLLTELDRIRASTVSIGPATPP